MAEKKLSKREQKAEAFKKRAKKPQFTDEMAVPQSDEIVPEPVKEEPVKVEKRKAEAISVPTEESGESQKKKNRRSKKSSNMDGSRYIVFVGNLPYATTVEELEKHFEHVEDIKSTRLLTDKATGKPKGFAFMEFEHSKDLNKALAFHHTFFKKRQINVELTAGGGGNKSETRKEKLKVKNERLTEERAKKHEELKGKAAPASSYKIDIPQ
ncbi:hypothetical protein EDC94DRAFT_598140 [Helicostylum pulchrum]|uniref:RRM domain-containing protein n=1 Tax=Helicostylum pulchrum TaxID=562976 RepID=A0ABP9Y050_9FUNG|nr:hypothetical protein EDC94DRAFT_598140 [Helicostylum pulchrum]